jgi:peptidoglycan/xylan/chitin deacetylase (PgdA/CDA1 family)
MRAVRDAGFEVGVHCWDHVRWQDFVVRRDADWTEREMQRASRRFQQIFGGAPRTWGAAGWQLNRHAAWYEERHFAYASDTRGSGPFRPLWDGVAIGCPQLPTTLPTLDELIGLHQDVVQHLLSRTGNADHVFTAHAELEGGKLMPMFEALLAGWKAQGYEIVALEALYRTLDLARLPRCEVVQGTVPGRSGTLAVQQEIRP